MKSICKKPQRVAVVERVKHRSQKKIPFVFTANLIKFIEKRTTKNIIVKNNNGDIFTLSSKDYSLIYL